MSSSSMHLRAEKGHGVRTRTSGFSRLGAKGANHIARRKMGVPPHPHATALGQPAGGRCMSGGLVTVTTDLFVGSGSPVLRRRTRS